jgi:uncharacterized coiled-coil protein SlyX
VNANPSLYTYPRGDTPAQLRQSLVTIVDQLNRRKNELPPGSATQAQIDELNAAIAASEAALADLNAALTTLDSQVTTNAADIVALFDALAGVGGSGLTPQQAFILGLVSAVDTVLGSVSQQVLETKRLSENLAKAAITELVRGRVDGANLRVEQAVRVTETEALAQQISTFDAQIANNAAQIVVEQTARADGDNALANSISSLTTTVNGNTANITTLQTSVGGVQARWGVVINLNGQVTGLVQLDGAASGSTFTVVADKFQIAQPGVSGGDPIPVYTITNVAGVAKLALRGDMIADGAIVARAIAAATITGDKIAANTITADRINVTSLSAIAANIGTVTAGKLQSTDTKMVVDLDNKIIRIEV